MPTADPQNLDSPDPDLAQRENLVSLAELESPATLRKTADQLAWRRKEIARDLKRTDRELKALEDYLGISDQVTQALDSL